MIGGQANAVGDLANAFQIAEKTGIGSVKVLLPESLKSTLGKVIPGVDYAPATPSGTFSKSALASWLDLADWADGVLLPGNLGHNSETAIVLDSFLSKFSGLVTLCKDALQSTLVNDQSLLARKNTILAVTLSELQKLIVNQKIGIVLRSQDQLAQTVDKLHSLSEGIEAALMLNAHGQYVVAYGGQVSSTKAKAAIPPELGIVNTATSAVVWAIQQPAKLFETLTTSLV